MSLLPLYATERSSNRKGRQVQLVKNLYQPPHCPYIVTGFRREQYRGRPALRFRLAAWKETRLKSEQTPSRGLCMELQQCSLSFDRTRTLPFRSLLWSEAAQFTSCD